ncbi:hypothetical protein DB30_03571 [Enhygromyxa salina]|uniref:Uncharacterized protein n=1 Tax=Enhygromyxa salina TaxID=215803 RepID=A0A0C2CJW2_9BACT|nr:hypothetical protein DB30_03571 [Enhygromyxa salina]
MCWGDTHVYSNNLAMCNTGNLATGSGLNCGNPFGWGQGDYIGCCCTQ